MRYLVGFVFVLAVLLMTSCGESAPNPVWKAICEVTCERGVQCFPEVPYGPCVSACLSEFGGIPCEGNQTRLDECVAGIAALSCTALEEGELPAECDEVCTGALCEAVDCDDQNDCTDDWCSAADGSCTNDPLADGTLCSNGMCLDGACGTVFPCTEKGIRDTIAVGGGPFTFACAGPTSVETSGTILIDRNVILDGEGNLTIDGGGLHPVLSVSNVNAELHNMTVTGGWATLDEERAPGIKNRGMLTLTAVTVTNNVSTGSAVGAISNEGTLTLLDSTVSNNEALRGSGVYNRKGGKLTLIDSRVWENSAFEAGGGIYNDGTTTLIRTSISDNTASWSSGGGVVNGPDAMLMLDDCVVSGNSAGFGGGGVGTLEAVDPGDSQITLLDTVVSGNSAVAVGGGLANEHPGTLTVVNSTISGNTASSGGGIGSHGALIVTASTVSGNSAEDGGGILFGGVPNLIFTLTNSTVSANTASNRGGGIYNLASTVLISSTLSGNEGVRGAAIWSAHSAQPSQPSITWRNTLLQGQCDVDAVTSSGGNIESPGDTCGLDHGTDLVNITEGQLDLGPLADNGGPTMTHALGAGSVAIDQIPAVECVDSDGEPLTTDQRGFPRGSMCDVGAFEVQP
jgi:hypothetical protein